MAGEHGTYSSYVIQRCRCEACRVASRNYARDRARRLAVEKWNPEQARWIDGDIVRAHLRSLMAAGMGAKTISAAAGYAGMGTVNAILWGKYLDQPDHPEHRPPRRRVRRDVADRLLAITVQLADGAKVDGTGTSRRLQALVAIGWSGSRLAELLGYDRASFTPILHGRGGTTAKGAAAVRALYDQLWDAPPTGTDAATRGSVSRARNFARSNGWPPPLAWDDDTIDDPDARPDLGEDSRLPLHERVLELADLGYRADEIADRLHVGASYLKSKLAGGGRRELLDRIARPRADDGHLPTASRPTRTGRAAKAA